VTAAEAHELTTPGGVTDFARLTAGFFNARSGRLDEFGQPGSAAGQPGFGKIASAGDPRIPRLTLKFLF
jgi:hypothetical protein